MRVKHSDPSGAGALATWGTDWAAAMVPGSGQSEQYCVRSNTSSSYGPWRTLIHSANYPSFNNFSSGLVTTNSAANIGDPTTPFHNIYASNIVYGNYFLPINGDNTATVGNSSFQFNNIFTYGVTSTTILTLAGYNSINLSNGSKTFANLSASAFSLNTALNTNGYGIHTYTLLVDSTLTASGQINANGGIALPTIALSASAVFDANSHNGRIINLGTSYVFNLSSMSAGNWCIVVGSGYVSCGSGVSYYLRGSSVTGSQRIMGSAVAWYSGSAWYVG